MPLPKVTVICLCYNHERFVGEAIESVIDQSYGNIEVIVVDDASTDGSAAIISALVNKNPSIKYIRNEVNLGMCKAFNGGWAVASGDYIIDFATDDVMMPDRILRQVEFFSTLGEDYGVIFTDAVYVNAGGKPLRKHYEHLKKKGLLENIPEGDVYQALLSTYFICSPTMMSRRRVFETLGGYDEMLSYEDFDFWVRSSRLFKYAFLDVVTTRVRRSARSMSTGWYKRGDRQLHSTYLVCKKAMALNQSEADRRALAKRLLYEIRQSVFSENYNEAGLFHSLLGEMGLKNRGADILMLLGKLKLPLAFLRKIYQRLRLGEQISISISAVQWISWFCPD